MQVFDQEIYDIVEKGLEGNGLSAENVLALYEVEETSKEAAYIRWAGQELSMIAADGVAEIHAQIGLNSTVCPKNCKFCSFAACNNVRKGKYELPKEDVLEYAKLYVEEGANLTLMLTTASYSFDKLVDMVGRTLTTCSSTNAASSRPPARTALTMPCACARERIPRSLWRSASRRSPICARPVSRCPPA